MCLMARSAVVVVDRFVASPRVYRSREHGRRGLFVEFACGGTGVGESLHPRHVIFKLTMVFKALYNVLMYY